MRQHRPGVSLYALRLLGSVVLEGPAGPLSGRAVQGRQLGLLALLAAAGRDGSSRDRLSAYMWPDAAPESAGHSLADVVYRLRKTLGEGAIEGRSATLRLNPALVRVDLIDFEDAVEEGDLARAVALYRGPFLDGFHLKDSSEFGHWRDAEAQRLERKLQNALETLADRATGNGDPMEAVGWLDRLLALDPFNSRTVLRLMEAQAAAGDPANAVKLATEHGELLADELGVELPAEVRALQEQLRAAEVPSTLGASVWAGSAPVRPGASPNTATGVAAVPPPSSPWRRSTSVTRLWGATATVLALWLAFGPNGREEADVAPVRLSITLPEGQRIPAGSRVADIEPSPMALSSDGSSLAYVAVKDGSRRLVIRKLDGFETRTLPGAEGALNPFFSPDGRWVGFVANATLMRQSLDGGPPQALSAVPMILGAVWTEADSIIVARGVDSGLSILSAAGGEPVPLTTLDPTHHEEWAHIWPELLPGGESLLFDRWLVPDRHEIAWMSLRDREWHTLLADARRPRYLPSGHLVFERQGQLQIQPFDADRMALSGSPVPFLETFKGFFSVSERHMVYLPAVDDPASRTLLRVDRRGDATPLLELPGTVLELHLSADGRRLLFVVLSDGKPGLHAYDLAGGQLERLGEGFWPVPGPGGEWVAFTDGRGVFRKRTDGTSEVVEHLHPTGHPTSWSAGGTLLLDAGDDIWVVDTEDGVSARALVSTQQGAWGGRFSPGGDMIAYASSQSGRDEVYVQPYPGPGGRRMVSRGGGADPLWSQDGRELFYRRGAEMWSVPVSTDGETTLGAPRLLFKRLYATRAVPSYAHDPATDAFIMSPPDSVVPSEFRVVVGWKAMFR
ncbi:MAG TPA: BTAD domain-containing putative transcriptional regulator [Longimicrobiales bacterium]|nr:BTAD domain-containing putative transcriptional regulator [Longimicrobiales bacterium]